MDHGASPSILTPHGFRHRRDAGPKRTACTVCVLTVREQPHRTKAADGVSTAQRGHDATGTMVLDPCGMPCSSRVCGVVEAFVRYIAVPDYNLSYFYVLVFFLVGAGFVTVILGASRLIARRKPSLEKSRTYESGEEPIGQAWSRYPSHFYIFALLFVVFDVEVIFLFPWAVLFRALGWSGLIEMFVFIAILVVGLFYAWRKQVLRWY